MYSASLPDLGLVQSIDQTHHHGGNAGDLLSDENQHALNCTQWSGIAHISTKKNKMNRNTLYIIIGPKNFQITFHTQPVYIYLLAYLFIKLFLQR